MIRPVVLTSMILVLVLLSAGCISPQFGENTVSHGAGSGYAVPDAYPVPGVAEYSRSMESQGVLTIVPTYDMDGAGVAGTDQKIIRTSSISLEVQNVSTTLDPLRAIATAHGGYLGSLSVNTQGGERLYAYLTIRVPAQSFDAAITEIKALGTLKSESLSADDVTEEYVDLQARRAALANQLAQYMRIMEQAENVSEILEVQEQIERVQVEIDRIDGRLKYLDNRVDYATISVSLQEPEPVGGSSAFSFVSVINEGIAGFLAVSAGLVVIIISIIPLIILAAIAYLIYRWWQHRKRPGQKKVDEREKGGGSPPDQ